MAHAGIRLSVGLAIGVLAVTERALAAPEGLVITQSPSCRVALTKVSYDGPGADDEELIELAVERFPPPSARSPDDGGKRAPAPMPACHLPQDSGAFDRDSAEIPDASTETGPRGLTLADCGLSEVRLVNGGAGACDEYRVIPLGAVVVPDDGFVLVCAQDSLFASSCDVNTAGRSAIRNGFLQNGPNDGVRFMGDAGAVALEIGYEGGPGCFSSGANLVDETGEAAGAPGQDDINIVCGGWFELVSASEAPLREPNRCRYSSVDEGGAGDAGAPVAASGLPTPGSSSAPLEFAPDAGRDPFLSASDASFTVPERQAASPPQPPSCKMAVRRGTHSGVMLAAVATAAAAGLMRRKRRLRSVPRADSFARFERAPRR